MPLKLIPPRPGKSPHWSVRGTHLGIYVDRSTKFSERRKAQQKLNQWRADIERGELARRGGPTFLSAAVTYMEAGHESRFVHDLVDYFGERPLDKIDQAAIDEAALNLLPDATAATRNRQIYTPVSAILKRAGIDFPIRRPAGSEGERRVAWLWPEEAQRIFVAAKKVDPEFALFLIFLCYTGVRLSEALRLQVAQVRLTEAFAYIAESKNEEPRAVFLPPVVVAALASHPRGMERAGETVFRFRKNGHLYNFMKETKTKAGKDLAWVTFHTFCHTWATWMRRYAGLDIRGLVGTGRWKDLKSAARYNHVVVSEESRRAVLLPVPKRRSRGKSVDSGRSKA